METAMLTVLTGPGALCKTAQITGITAGIVLILACIALINHRQPAAGTYMLTYYGLAQAGGTGFIRAGLPTRPGT